MGFIFGRLLVAVCFILAVVGGFETFVSIMKFQILLTLLNGFLTYFFTTRYIKYRRKFNWPS